MNIVDQILGILTTPIAKRKGVIITAEECKIWAEELQKYLNERRG